MSNITLFIHLYYPGSWSLIRKECDHAIGNASRIIITTVHKDVAAEVDLRDNEKITILKVTNKGKDIGGKLAAFSYYLNFCERTPYLALLHDKVSPQTINVEYWSTRLYSIFGKENFTKAIDRLDRHPGVGLLGAATFLKSEYIRSQKKFDTTNNDLLWELLRNYNIECKTYNFIAGTIFIARSILFEKFFSENSPLAARQKLEEGNVLDLIHGTYTHSWERLFCFIAEAQGYAVKGI